MQIIAVEREKVPALWPHVADLVEKHCDLSKGEYAVGQVAEDMLNGSAEYWLAYDAEADKATGLLCTQETKDGSGRGVFIIVWAVGADDRREDWAMPALDHLEAVARERGHHRFTTIGRKGWARKELKGFKITRYVYEKELAA